MLKKTIYLIISIYMLIILTSFAHGSITPIKDISGNNKCYYKISGTLPNNSVYSGMYSVWNETPCDQSIELNSLGIGDGTYYLNLKADDKVSLGHDKNYTDGSGTSKTNKYGISTFGPYKIDSTAPTCILKEVRFLAGFSHNQYYNGGKFYYKGNGGNGQFELVIESDDTNNGVNTNVSQIEKINFPTLLGAHPIAQTFTNSGKVTVVGKYIWSGTYTDNYDILNNLSKLVCYDNAGNAVPLTSDTNTKLIFQDGNHIVNGLTSLMLTPDTSVPNVVGIPLNNLSNGFKIQSGNNGSGPFVNIFSGTTSQTKPFSALHNRQIEIPQFQDVGSGLRSFQVKIEQFGSGTQYDSYVQNLSNENTLVTSLTNTGITHNFSLVDNDYNGMSGYRNYTWEIESLDLGGNPVFSNKICDMVGNCVTTPTPEFRVVANTPTLAINPDLGSGQVGIKHSLNKVYSGNTLTMRSNLSDAHSTLVIFEDQYGNAIVPVYGIKNIELNINFDNSLGCDQMSPLGANQGDCVDFTFKNLTNTLNGYQNPSVNEYSQFQYKFNNYSQLLEGTVGLQISSAIPTKNEYKTTGGDHLYGTLPAKLVMNNFNIKADDLTGYGGIGETGAIELAIPGATEYKWSPIINFHEVGNIYPLVEGQEKSVDIKNFSTDNMRLLSYKLETKIGTNNLFLQFRNIYLSDGNILYGNNNYDILKNSGFSTPYGNGEMEYTDNDTYNFLPKTIGGISNTNTKLAFYSKLSYKVGSKSPTIPSVQSGFNWYGPHSDGDFLNDSQYQNGSDITLAELDIRGKTQTKNDGGNITGSGAVSTDGVFKDFSKITLYDFKTEINKNVAKLLNSFDRNNGKVVGGQYTFSNLTNFPTDKGIYGEDGKFIYFKDTDITLDCGNVCNINGTKTIIVENGNIFIKSNLQYDTSSSIIGFILIGNKDTGNKSQFRISSSVTNGVGMVYSDGPIISVDSLNNIIYDGNNVPNRKLANQLYWLGSFATKNTIGGAIKNQNGFCPYGTPDYNKTSCTIQKAQGYDLIYLRRYARIDRTMYGITNNIMGGNKVPANIDVINVKIAGGDEYEKVGNNLILKTTGTFLKPTKMNYDAPFILEYDSRIQKQPPLGFK